MSQVFSSYNQKGITFFIRFLTLRSGAVLELLLSLAVLLCQGKKITLAVIIFLVLLVTLEDKLF